MRTNRRSVPQNFIRQLHRLLAAALCCYIPVAVHAQFNYASDNRSISASGSINTNSIAAGYMPPASTILDLAYSGDYSFSGGPPGPLAYFNNSVGGGDSASITVQYNYISGHVVTTSSFGGNSSAGQTSFLTPTEMYYQGSIYADFGFPGPPRVGLGSEHASSLFQESFSVASPANYHFTITYLGFSDWLFGDEFQWSLSSANLGSILIGPNWPYLQAYTFDGVLEPNDTYTLSLAAYGFTDNNLDFGAGTITADFTIPEPASGALAGLASVLCLLCRGWSSILKQPQGLTRSWPPAGSSNTLNGED